MRRGEPRRRARLCTSVCVCAGHGVGGVLSSSGGRASLPLELECRARRCCAAALVLRATQQGTLSLAHRYTYIMIRQRKLPYELRALLAAN